jgi:hypothetical protein
VVPEDMHDFFLASGGIAGALIGLLFVAISVSADRLARQEASTQLHRIRAVAAFTAFINALVISLFSLVPDETIGWTSVSVALVGLAFVVASLLSLVRLRAVHWGTVRDGVFLVGLVVIFIIQLSSGLALTGRPGDVGAVHTLAYLVIGCFLVGISRAWELIGGPSIVLTREVTALILDRNHHGEAASPEDGQPPPS